MGRFSFFVPALFVCLGLASCMEQGSSEPEDVEIGVNGLFIVNEGGFGSGTASLSHYDMETEDVTDHVFYKANGVPLGDVAQSMTVYDGCGWIVVNNSKVIFSVGLSDMKEKGRITGLTSPRHMQFISATKAYVTDMYERKIAIVDPRTYSVTGSVETGCTTEQLVVYGGYVYVNSWSYGTEILKIDPASDMVVDRLEVGIQPCSMALDSDGGLWVLADGGGWEGNPAGYEKPSLLKVDLGKFEVERELVFNDWISVSDLTIDDDGDTVYWLGSGVWKMDTSSRELPDGPFIPAESGQAFYALAVDPSGGDIFVADAVDYSQNGKVYRYTSDGYLKDDFTVGICPGAFCWH